MKRFIKFFALALSIMLLCTALTGCGFIDELRETKAVWNNDGSIAYKGSKYISLPECELLDPDMQNTMISICQSDVPVLLSKILGNYALISKDEKLIGFEDSYSYKYYCRADAYDEIVARISGEIKLDKLCYIYDVYNDDTFEYETAYYVLNDIQVSAIEKTIAQGKKSELPDEAFIDSEHTVYIEACSEDLLFKSGYYIYEIYKTGDKYYLLENTEEDYILYTVPADLNDEYDYIMEKYIKAYGEMYGDYTDF